MLVHPTRRQISIDCICKLDLALRRTRTEIVSAKTKERCVFFSSDFNCERRISIVAMTVMRDLV